MAAAAGGAPGFGSLRMTALNGVRVYSVSGGASAPPWLSAKRRRALRKDDAYLRRLELVQDMDFDTASTRIKATPDGAFLVASGVYPPQVRVYELSQLSLKFERHLDAEIIDFQARLSPRLHCPPTCQHRRPPAKQARAALTTSILLVGPAQILSEDYSKLAFLMGRDLAYDSASCDLLVAASSPQVYRLNLEQGSFLTPLTTQSPSVNVLGISPTNGLVVCGGEDGAVEFFDPRQKQHVARISATGPGAAPQEVTALRFEDVESMQLAVGTDAGMVMVYDLRSSVPLQTKDHMYGRPIVDIKWHKGVNSLSRHIISADSKILKIWNPETPETLTSIEPSEGDINDVCNVKDSGLLLLALDAPRMQNFFIPELGPAPQWCSFLDNLTEEMEEERETVVYDNFKFVTHDELERLQLSHLVGTPLLRAYMHGYFLDARLFHKAKAIVDPFAYETYRKKRIEERVAAERAARITVKRKLPKVNPEYAARLLAKASGEEAEEEVEVSKSKSRSRPAADLLADDRFAVMFEDEAFAVDEDAPEYRALHPNADKGRGSHLLQEHFDLVDAPHELDDLTTSREEDAGEGGGSRRPDGRGPASSRGAAAPGPRLYEARDEAHAAAYRNATSLAGQRSMELAERVAQAELGRSAVAAKGGGSREISFTSRRKHGRSQGEREQEDTVRKAVKPRRGIAALGLQSRSAGGRGGRGRSGGGHRGGRGTRR
eukprot:SM000109S14135  [mRNA]  locus=s109:19278:23306:- [translate_table: standard]